VAERPGSRTRTQLRIFEGDLERTRSDHLATEEPLEIRLIVGGETKPVAVTMRTPGADFELAIGFLFGEGVIRDREHVLRISYCTDPEIDAEQQFNIVNVKLDPAAMPDLRPLERHFFTSSACGVCGKASLEALELRGCPAVPPGPQVRADVIYELPEKLRAAQGLFTADGDLVTLREDVGRHNAVDKVIGWALLQDRLPLNDHIVMVSGRSSFEIMQKCLVAGVPIVGAVSAPSSLAVALAKEFNVTLIGFLRGNRFNVYAGEERIRTPVPAD
jgi:FdhD protein